MDKLPFYRSIRFKLLVGLTLIILIGSGAGLYQSMRIADDNFRELLLRQFRTTEDITENFIEFLGQISLIRAKELAADKEFERLIIDGEGRGDALRKHTIEVMESASADSLIVVDKDGLIIARGDDRDSLGTSLKSIDIVKKILSDREPSFSIIQDFNNFILFSSAMIPGAGDAEVAGALLLGYSINDTFLENIKKNIGVEMAVVRDRAVMASTLFEGKNLMTNLPIPYIEYQLLLESGTNIISAEILGRSYFIGARKLRGMEENISGSLLLAYPKTELVAIADSLKRKFAALFFLGFLMVIYVEYRISRWLLSPVRSLVEVTDSVSNGRLDSSIEVVTRDEFGVLAAHFNSMVTSLREKDKELKAYSHDLEGLVELRTHELEDSNRLMELFLDLICHDISNPINVVRTTSEMLIETEEEETKKELIELILYSSTDIIELVKNASTMSRLKATSEIELSPQDISGILRNSIDGFGLQLKEKKVTIEGPGGEEHISDVNIIIKEVFYNLISNAIKYSPPEGRIVVEVSDKGSSLLVSVKDYGKGIPDEDMEKVFKRFERLEEWRGKGTGLGLSIAKRIVGLHKGSIWVEKNLEGGSIFFVSLPK